MGIIRSLTQLLFALILALPIAASAQTEDAGEDQGIDQGQKLLTNLAEAPDSKVEEAINAIVSSGDERARGWI